MPRIKYILLSILWLHCTAIHSQDIHFSHIHASPLALNPALTGVFEGDLRMIANYRNQWSSVNANFQTFMFSADLNFPGLNQNSILGIGTQFYSDVAGDLDYSTNSASFSLSLMQAFDKEKSHILSGAIQFGKISTQFDGSKAITYEEENSILLNGANNSSYMDIAAGLLWYKRINKKNFIYLGGSMYHLNKPVFSFFDSGDISNELYRRMVAHGGANIRMNDYLTLIPNFIFMKQGPHQQLTFGSFVRYFNSARFKKGETQTSLMFGAWLRAFQLENGFGADAVVTAIRVDYDTFTFSFTYDINISTLTQISAGRGGPELSIIYTIGSPLSLKSKSPKKEGTRRKKEKIKCPVL